MALQGGQNAPKGRFPYMTSVKITECSYHECGGVVIDRWHVLTAAHCDVGPHPLVHIGSHVIHDDHNSPGVQVRLQAGRCMGCMVRTCGAT